MLFKSEKLLALTMLDKLCCSFFCPALYRRCPRHDRVQNFCHTFYSLFVSQEHTTLSADPESNIFVVSYRYCASQDRLEYVSHVCTSQEKSAKQCAELILFLFTTFIYGCFKDADGNSYNQEGYDYSWMTNWKWRERKHPRPNFTQNLGICPEVWGKRQEFSA